MEKNHRRLMTKTSKITKKHSKIILKNPMSPGPTLPENRGVGKSIEPFPFFLGFFFKKLSPTNKRQVKSSVNVHL